MTDAMRELVNTIRECTIPYRLGAEVTTKQIGDVRVVEVFGYPMTPSWGELVNVYFIDVGFTEAVAEYKADPGKFLSMIELSQEGEFTDLTMEELYGGPSYVTLGAWLGSQEIALRFMALVEFIGLGKVLTPETLGATGEQADMIAGSGGVWVLVNRPVVVGKDG